MDFESFSSEIRTLTTRKCGIIRNKEDLLSAFSRIGDIFEQLDNITFKSKKGIETYNQSLIASAILRASIQRKKSVGSHYRSDD